MVSKLDVKLLFGTSLWLMCLVFGGEQWSAWTSPAGGILLAVLEG